MKIYKLEKSQLLDIDLETAWKFFSDPKNLQKITPSDLSFNILSPLPEKVYPGLIILYKIKIFSFIPFNWVTEITQVRENEFFIDEQRFGPYKFWHHQHSFEKKNGKTLMKDTVHYGLPYGIFGRLGKGIVQKQLRQIFDYRKSILSDIAFWTKIKELNKK